MPPWRASHPDRHGQQQQHDNNNDLLPLGQQLHLHTVGDISDYDEESEVALLHHHEVTHKKAARDVTRRPALQLLFGATGICTAYLYYGHVQEDLFRYQSPSASASFTSVWLLQALESVANIAVGLAGRRFFGGRPGLAIRPLFVVGTSQLFAKTLTSMALAAGLAFPVVILAKVSTPSAVCIVYSSTHVLVYMCVFSHVGL
jgi:hypothetical protein